MAGHVWPEKRPTRWGTITLAAGLLLTAAVTVVRLDHRGTGALDTPAKEFSSARAMAHLKEVSKAAHPMGSTEHQRVREHIAHTLASLGITAETQTATVAWKWWGTYRIGDAHNVVARLRGDRPQPAVLLVAHYDTVPTSPGAMDNGSGVAILLEAARAMRSGPILKHDVILLFADGEEVAVYGTRAFVTEHPWAKDVGVAITLDNLGNGGRARVLETTTPDDGWMVEHYARAVDHPVASSLITGLTRRLAHSITDLDMVRQAGIPGLWLAGVRGWAYYHSSADTYNQVNESFIEDSGTKLLALARSFSNTDLQPQKARPAAFFDLFSLCGVAFPLGFAYTLAGLTLTVIFAAALLAIRARRISGRGVLLGGLAFVMALALLPALGTGLWRLMKLAIPEFQLSPQGDAYGSASIYLGLAVFVATAFTAGRLLLAHRLGEESVTTGILLACAVGLAALTAFAPEGSFVLALPLLGAAVARTLSRAPAAARMTDSLISCALAVLALALLLPASSDFKDLLKLDGVFVALIPIVLLMGLLPSPRTWLPTRKLRWATLAVVGLSALGLLTKGTLESRTDVDHPGASRTVFYALDADDHRALWGSEDGLPDSWSRQFVGLDPSRMALPAFFPLKPARTFLTSPAPDAGLEAPTAVVERSEQSGDERELWVRVRSPRHAPILSLYLDAPDRVVASEVQGIRLEESERFSTGPEESKSRWALTYDAPPAKGFLLHLCLRRTGAITLRVVDQSYDLPVVVGRKKTRPANRMQTPSGFAIFYPGCEPTLVGRSFEL